MWFLPLLILATTIALSIPFGRFLAWIMDGKYHPPRWLRWLERRVDSGPQTWKQYAIAMLLFNTVMFAFGFLVLTFQDKLPLNQYKWDDPTKDTTLAPTTVFNTVTSFFTNTDLQDYSGEQHLTYFSQIFFVLFNMFLSASVGFCAFACIIRSLRGETHTGNYYLDMWRVVVYFFIPTSLLMGVLLMPAGVPMTLENTAQVETFTKEAMGTESVEVNGVKKDQAVKQKIARGPVAAVIPIKHLGTNGGGFFGANSAHPFENPGSWTNFMTCVNILVFPFSLVVMFGRMLNKTRHAAVIYCVMLSIFLVMIGWGIATDSQKGNPALEEQAGQVYPLKVQQKDGSDKNYWMVANPGRPPELVDRDPNKEGEEDKPKAVKLIGLPVDQGLGNLEGKELRFGTSAGPTFSAITTAVACGSVNCMHDSLNPLAGITPFTGMWLNCVFGGKGVGMINLLVYLITGVFLAGLMVGRTPEYLGKKVEAREMKLAMLALLIHPIMILAPAGIFAAKPDWGIKAEASPGAHGFSEILYQFSSASANNGSGFEGLADTWGFNDAKNAPPTGSPPAPTSPPLDIAAGLVMIFSRFIPIIAPMALAAGLALKKPTPFTSGTLRTDTLTFGFLLLGTILLVGALLFLPAAVLGPVAEHLGPMPFGG